MKKLTLLALFLMLGFASIWGLNLLPFSEAKTPPVSAPNKFELADMKKLAADLPGRILFDSNRSGNFGIYSISLDGQDLQKVSNTPKHEIFPDPSPDGRFVVFNE